MSRNWRQGEFTPRYPNKCLNIRKGKKPFARSSWETNMFNYCDLNENVIEWGSEILQIPYIITKDKKPLEGKTRRYFPDIWCRVKTTSGEIKTYILEIKPNKQTLPPKPPKIKTKKAVNNFNLALFEYYKNQSKWYAARQYCETRKWEFQVITENKKTKRFMY